MLIASMLPISSGLRQSTKIFQRDLRFMRILPAPALLFAVLNTLSVEIATRISDVDLHISLTRNALNVFLLCIVGLVMCDHSSVLGYYMHIVVVAVECVWMAWSLCLFTRQTQRGRSWLHVVLGCSGDFDYHVCHLHQLLLA